MAAVSEVSICNQALLALGANPITSIDDDTVEAKLCKVNYDPIRDAVLERQNWTFAIAWLQLPAAVNPPLSEFANAFPLPADVVRVVFVGDGYNYPDPMWQVQGNSIVTNATACKCQVVQIVDDPGKFSPLFVQAFVARLAAEMAIPLTNSRAMYETQMQVYNMKMKDAMSSDGLQGKARRIRSKWLNDSRYQGPSTAGPYV